MSTYDDRRRPRPPKGPGPLGAGPTGLGAERFVRPAVSRRSRQAVHRRRRLAGLVFLALMTGLILRLVAGGGTPSGAGTRGIATRAPSRPAVLVSPNEAAREAEAIDRTLAYTPYVRIAGTQHREIALTFDDGPGPYTVRILAALQAARVPATFFEIGVLQRYFHDATSAIVAAGDVIGDHTFSHAPMSKLSVADQRTQILQDSSVVGQFGAPFPRLFRPPYGLFDKATLGILRQFHMLMVLWTVDTEDYRLPGAGAIVRSVVQGARPGAIMLLHDAGGDRAETAEALPIIIRELHARGYRLVTVPRLLADNPPPRKQDIGAISGSGG